MIFRFSSFSGLLLLSLFPTLYSLLPKVERGRFSGYSPLSNPPTPGSSTHYHIWKENIFNSKRHGEISPKLLPFVKVKVEMKVFKSLLHNSHYQAIFLLQNDLIKIGREILFFTFLSLLSTTNPNLHSHSLDPEADGCSHNTRIRSGNQKGKQRSSLTALKCLCKVYVICKDSLEKR